MDVKKDPKMNVDVDKMSKKGHTPDEEDYIRKKDKEEREYIDKKIKESETSKKNQVQEEKPKEFKLEAERVYEEPVRNNDTPKWLNVTQKQSIPLQDGKNLRERIEKTNEEPPEPVWHINFKVKEQNLFSCNKCGAIRQYDEKPMNCNDCERPSTFKQITKAINPDFWKLPYWEDIPAEKIDMKVVYEDIYALLKRCVTFAEEIQYEIFALWIIASWKVECFDTVPFLIFRGLIETGKTRCLDLIQEMGYRMMHTSGVTFPAMCRATHFWNAGVLIDEIDSKVNTKHDEGRKLMEFLKPSYRRGSVYSVADKDDQTQILVYRNYGFKAFAGEKGGYDQAIFSRSIDFQMEQVYPDVPELKYVKAEMDRLQTYLLNYRYKYHEPPDLPFEFVLRGRDREIFSCIIRTAEHIGLNSQHIIDYAQRRRKEIVEDLQETDEFLILKAVHKLSGVDTQSKITGDVDAPERINFRDIAMECGWAEDSDLMKKKTMRISYIFRKKFMLKTKRYTEGNSLILNDDRNQRKLNSLFRRYKVD